MSDISARLECLKLALSHGQPPDSTVKAARQYYDFILDRDDTKNARHPNRLGESIDPGFIPAARLKWIPGPDLRRACWDCANKNLKAHSFTTADDIFTLASELFQYVLNQPSHIRALEVIRNGWGFKGADIIASGEALVSFLETGTVPPANSPVFRE